MRSLILAGLASGYAFVPPSAGSVLVANALGVNLGTMMAIGIPVALVSTVVAGIIWGKIIGNKIYTKLPANVEEIADIDEKSSILRDCINDHFNSAYSDLAQHNLRISSDSGKCAVSSSVFRRTVCGTDDRNSDSNVHAGNKNGV